MAIINSVRVIETQFGSFSLHYSTPAGRRRRISVGKDRRQAERLARRFEDWLFEFKDPEVELERMKQVEKSRSITLRQFYPLFIERYGKMQSASMQRLYVLYISSVGRCPNLADVPLLSITKGLMLDFMQARMKLDSITPATANREASFVRCMLNRAVEWEMIDRNPLIGLRMFRESEKRDVEISPEQVSALLDNLSEPVANITEFAVFSGFRLENILSLKIEKIHFHDLTPSAQAELVVKGGKTRKFQLGKQAVEVLKRAIGDRKSGYVFLNPYTGTRYNTVHKSFDNAVRKNGLTVNGTKLRFHDLRHCFATWLRDAGVSLDDIRPLLGHADRSTTDRYVTINTNNAGKMLDLLPMVRRQKQG